MRIYIFDRVFTVTSESELLRFIVWAEHTKAQARSAA